MAVGQKAPAELLRDESDLQYLRKPAPPKLWQDLQQSHGALLMDTGKAASAPSTMPPSIPSSIRWRMWLSYAPGL